jgi:hypothetical protein
METNKAGSGSAATAGTGKVLKPYVVTIKAAIEVKAENSEEARRLVSDRLLEIGDCEAASLATMLKPDHSLVSNR